MTQQSETFRAALKDAKRWADLFSFVSIVLVIGLGILSWWLGNSSNVDLETKLEMQIMMASIVIVVSIWQAAAFAVASLRSARESSGNTDSNTGQQR